MDAFMEDFVGFDIELESRRRELLEEQEKASIELLLKKSGVRIARLCHPYRVESYAETYRNALNTLARNGYPAEDVLVFVSPRVERVLYQELPTEMQLTEALADTYLYDAAVSVCHHLGDGVCLAVGLGALAENTYASSAQPPFIVRDEDGVATIHMWGVA